MKNRIKTGVRLYIVAVIIITVIFFVSTFVAADPYPNRQYDIDADVDAVDPAALTNATVVTTQYNEVKDLTGAVAVFDATGTPVYYDDSLSSYWDVDPTMNRSHSITYVATERLNESTCGTDSCKMNVIQQVNLTTGDIETVYTHRAEGGRWHDVDQLNDTHFLVADYGADAVFIVDTETGIRPWTWTVESDVSKQSGGAYAGDWAHLNDVEYLPDGRIMVSLRNQDRVVFVDPTTGIEPEWTLGSEDDYEILYEQHNPDYIPAARGGPAVLVADSENTRIVEYHRDADGAWNQTWQWRDNQLQWPRDADRLPNGHTLVTDSNGNRVVTVNQTGAVVQTIPIARPYEAERLGSGPESSGGEARTSSASSATSSDGDQTTAQAGGFSLRGFLESIVPTKIRNGIAYVLPVWAGFQHALAGTFAVGNICTWLVIEVYWSRYSVSTYWPVKISK